MVRAYSASARREVPLTPSTYDVTLYGNARRAYARMRAALWLQKHVRGRQARLSYATMRADARSHLLRLYEQVQQELSECERRLMHAMHNLMHARLWRRFATWRRRASHTSLIRRLRQRVLQPPFARWRASAPTRTCQRPRMC